MAARVRRPAKTAGEPYPSWQDPAAMSSDPWWLVYARLSVAADEDETGIDRQLDDCFDYAVRAGARRVAFRVDDGISAWKDRKRRDAFELVIEELTALEAQTVVAWKPERLARRPRDAERLLDAVGDIQGLADAGRAHARVLTVLGGGDTDTDGGRLVFRLMVQFGEWESSSISRRVGRKHMALAESGYWSGSPRPFGHRSVREAGGAALVAEPSQADLIREAAGQILVGEGLVSIHRDWAKRGILTSGGKPWQHSALRKLLVSPRMVGLRILRGVEGTGHIEPILDRAELGQASPDPHRSGPIAGALARWEAAPLADQPHAMWQVRRPPPREGQCGKEQRSLLLDLRLRQGPGPSGGMRRCLDQGQPNGRLC